VQLRSGELSHIAGMGKLGRSFMMIVSGLVHSKNLVYVLEYLLN
jgi:hypothetical protein